MRDKKEEKMRNVIEKLTRENDGLRAELDRQNEQAQMIRDAQFEKIKLLDELIEQAQSCRDAYEASVIANQKVYEDYRQARQQYIDTRRSYSDKMKELIREVRQD